MCRAYRIDFRGTPRCVHSSRKLGVPYCCALHFQTTVYPQVIQFTQAVIAHEAPTHGTKIDTFDILLQCHLRQFGYCAYITHQTTYYEAARTLTYMILHHNNLPEGVTAPPRTHDEIITDLHYVLQHALQTYRDDALVKPGLPKAEQPQEAQFLFAFPLIGDEHFDERYRELREGTVTHYTFADIFDDLGCGTEGSVSGSGSGSGGDESPEVDLEGLGEVLASAEEEVEEDGGVGLFGERGEEGAGKGKERVESPTLGPVVPVVGGGGEHQGGGECGEGEDGWPDGLEVEDHYCMSDDEYEDGDSATPCPS